MEDRFLLMPCDIGRNLNDLPDIAEQRYTQAKLATRTSGTSDVPIFRSVPHQLIG